jgi:hypothetical protein
LRFSKRPEPLRLHCAHLGGVYRSRAALVDASGLGLGDPLKLALAAQVRLEFREHAQHVQKALAGGGAGVDRLLGAAGKPISGPAEMSLTKGKDSPAIMRDR